MARAPFGHVSRHCVRCGEVGPRVAFDGGWAHARCLTAAELRDAGRRRREAQAAARRDEATPAATFMDRIGSTMPADVGWALGRRGDAKLRIDSLVVPDGMRLTGVAGCALDALRTLADDLGVTLTADVWPREGNSGAIPQDALTRLFERHGFRGTGIGHTMRREPARPDG